MRTNALLVRPGLQLLHRYRSAVVAVRANFPKGATAQGGITTTATATPGRSQRQPRAVDSVQVGSGDDTVRRHFDSPVAGAAWYRYISTQHYLQGNSTGNCR